jgi:hypothetical protein
MVDMMMVFDEMNANPINWVLLLAILYLCWVILAPMPAAVRWVMMNECVTSLCLVNMRACCLWVWSGVTYVCTRVGCIVRTSRNSRAKRGRSRMGVLLCPAATQASLRFCPFRKSSWMCCHRPPPTVSGAAGTGGEAPHQPVRTTHPSHALPCATQTTTCPR